jgi:hypothetical protein
MRYGGEPLYLKKHAVPVMPPGSALGCKAALAESRSDS